MTVFEKSTVRPARRDLALVQNLQQDIHNVRMCFFDLVEQHDAVGMAADLLGQLPGLVVADIARGRADEAGHRVLFHVLAHVDGDERSTVSNSWLASCLTSSVLPTPVGPTKIKLAGR